jgi:GR25 family glycosyltransferase involved in LPS biosynthesis
MNMDFKSMKIYIINLAQDQDRKQAMLVQLNAFAITNYEFVEAVDGRNLSDQELTKLYDDKTAKKLHKQLARSEIGCALSHIKVYEKIIKENKRCLILEDDVVLSDTFKNFIDIEIDDPCDVIFFGVNSSNCEHEGLPKTYEYKNVRYSTNGNGHRNRCYLKESYTTHGNVNFYDLEPQSHKVDFLSGTFAYAPSVDACKKIIRHNRPIRLAADHVWNEVDLWFRVPKQNIVDVDYSIASVIQPGRVSEFKGFSNRINSRINHPNYNK